MINEIYNLTKNLTVLYVEDDDDLRNSTLPIFQKIFLNVDIAKDGKEGYSKYIDFKNKTNQYYDIVISDIEMPFMNGIELTKAIYKQNSNQTVIIISAYSDPKYLIEFINIGIKYFLLKPFELYEMIDVFKKVIDNMLFSNNSIKLSNELYFNTDTLELCYKNSKIKLTKKEMLFIELLIKSKERVIPYDDIYYCLWDTDINTASTKTLNPLISRLKKKLPIPIIESIYGIGYRLNISIN